METLEANWENVTHDQEQMQIMEADMKPSMCMNIYKEIYRTKIGGLCAEVILQDYLGKLGKITK